MFGYELVLTVCTLAKTECRELPPIPLQPEVGVIGCAMAAQTIGAKWVVDHPNFYVQRARCAPFNRYART
jgi:hypothetical protein